MGITHLDEAARSARERGHLAATWTFLGNAAGSVDVGVNRIELGPGGWSTPAHVHGEAEEIFYVLGGAGVSWQDGKTYELREGDCVVYAPRGEAHTLHSDEGLDVLAFGPRSRDESAYLPRAGVSWLASSWVPTGREEDHPWARELVAGPPELPEQASARPASIVNVVDVAPEPVERPRVARTRRNLGRAAGSVTTGLQHVEVAPGKYSTAQHCHSAEEELFVVLAGDGFLLLDEEETPVRPGNVVARPPGTGVSHAFRAGDGGLTYLAYGTRVAHDICYYPRSQKIFFRGLGVIARVEPLEYWDGED